MVAIKFESKDVDILHMPKRSQKMPVLSEKVKTLKGRKEQVILFTEINS